MLAVVLLLGWLIPQQSTLLVTDTTREVWIASLPAPLQLGGEPLFFLGFSRLFQTIWFWGPLALLLLNCLVALADYGPGSWQRLRRVTPSLEWQHPWAHRVEYASRLPESPDQFLEAVKLSLQEKGFYLYESAPTEERIVGAARRRWAWLGPVVLYVGLLIFIVALLLSSYLLQTDSFTLLPNEPKPSALFEGEFESVGIDAQQGLSDVTFTPSGGEQPSMRLTWHLYRPTLFNGAFILPTAISPILTVEARDATDALLRLIPSQENLAPAEQLHLPLDEANSPLYFLIPSVGLAFQIQPDPTSENLYHVQVRRGSELAPSTEVEAQAGEVFRVNEVSLTLAHHYDLKVLTYRDPALPLYLIGLVLVVVAASFISWQSPLQLWLAPEIKGRGGQLYSVVEKFGSVENIPQFLDQFLNPITKEEA
jgi:cytochrome c biogenesis protein ResB